MSPTRWLLVLLIPCVITYAALTGCGGGDAGVRVRLQTLAGDGEPPGPFFLVPVQAASLEARIPLTPIEAGSDILIARDAPAGSYVVLNDQGWQMLRTGQQMPRLHANEDGAPNDIAMARPYTLYLAPRAPQHWRLSEHWALQRVLPTDPVTYGDIPVQASLRDHGWVAMQLPEALCVPGARFRVLGLMEGNVLSQAIPLEIPDPAARPYVRLVTPSSTDPMLVRIVGGDAAAEGAEIHARLIGIPLDHDWVQQARGGYAEVPSAGEIGDGLRIAVPGWGAEALYDIGLAEWRRVGRIYIHALPTKDRREIRIEGQASLITHVSSVQALGTSFGRLPTHGQGADVVVYAPPGAQTLLVATPTGPMILDVDATATTVAMPAPRPGASLSGSVPVKLPGYRVMFQRRVGERWVGGAGLDFAVASGGRYEALLPGGVYRVTIGDAGNRVGKWAKVPEALTGWGAKANYDFDDLP